MNPADILQAVVIAISSWTLVEVISLGKKIERHDQKLKDLPCGDFKTK